MRGQIHGQITLDNYIKDIEVYELDIRGICDDPYCPKCNYPFWTDGKRSEIDCKRCPSCGIRVSWARWHLINDEEDENADGEAGRDDRKETDNHDPGHVDHGSDHKEY